MDLTSAIWRTSSYSGGNNPNCVQVAGNMDSVVAIRDSKNPQVAAHVISRTAFRKFVSAVVNDKFRQ